MRLDRRMSAFLPVGSPMGTLHIDEIFDYFDAPILFLARNELGYAFLGMSVEKTAGYEIFLYVPVSADRLLAIRTGLVSIRFAFTNPESGTVLEIMSPLDGD